MAESLFCRHIHLATTCKACVLHIPTLLFQRWQVISAKYATKDQAHGGALGKEVAARMRLYPCSVAL